MTWTLGTDHIAAQLAATIAFADGASGPSRIRLYTTDQPAAGGDPGAPHIVDIVLAKPCATLADGVMTLHPASGGAMVLTSGRPKWARWERSDAKLVADGKTVDAEHELDGDLTIVGGTTAPGDDSPTLQAGGLVLLGALTFG
ncbi:hypothetical protein [Acidovorax sp. A1169]|uniref:hypothetical protein n=1 Tax=Acidovorax sp. A1169 TaxID=3059524 RepID=UPI0027378697|nr:hypothetical protein [Acidovorax sp. A1169]MDP4074947.1 hypothetical protein [Acidovorax sp. A1169]